MIIEWIYQHRRGLGGGFVTGVLLYTLIALISPHHIMLGILLFGIFVASAGLGGAVALSILCLLLAGMVGAALGVAIEMGINHYCNRLENRQLSTVLLEETEPTQNIGNDFKGMEDIGDFKDWGETVRTSLYEKTVAEKIDEVKKELKSGTEWLVKEYKKLAFKYHPDKERDPSEKDRKKIAFQTLCEVRKTIEKHWEFALRGIDAPMYSEEPESDIDTCTGLELLREYRDLLERACKEMEDFLNSENLDKLIDEAIDKAIAKRPEYADLWSKERNAVPQATQEEEMPLNNTTLNFDQ